MLLSARRKIKEAVNWLVDLRLRVPSLAYARRVRGLIILHVILIFWMSLVLVVSVQAKEEDYKYARAKEIAEMTKDFGLYTHHEILVAHLYSENGAMAEDIITDGGCSFGLLQWNACAHYRQSARRYLSEHPEMKDYRTQVRFYLAEMRWRYMMLGTIDNAIGSWNPGAWNREIRRAYDQLDTVRELLK